MPKDLERSGAVQELRRHRGTTPTAPRRARRSEIDADGCGFNKAPTEVAHAGHMAKSLDQEVHRALARGRLDLAAARARAALEAEGAPPVLVAQCLEAIAQAGGAAAIADLADAAGDRFPGSGAVIAARSLVAAGLGDHANAQRLAGMAAAAADREGFSSGDEGVLDARLHLAAGDAEAAKAALHRVLAEHPAHAPAFLLMSEVLERQGEFESAAEAARAHAEVASGAAESSLRSMRLMLRAGRPARAIEIAEQARATSGIEHVIAAEWSGALHACGRFREAAEVAATGLQARPSFFGLHRQRILSLLAGEDLQAARAAVLAMIRTTEITEGAAFVIGTYLRSLADATEREAFLADAVSANPHPRIEGLRSGAGSAASAAAIALASREPYERVIFPPDDLIPELGAIFADLALPFSKQLGTWARNRSAGRSSPLPVTACTVPRAKVHVKAGHIVVLDRAGEPLDLLFRPPSGPLVEDARSAAVSARMDEVFLVNGNGVKNYSLWCLDALPQLAVARRHFPQARVLVPALGQAPYMAPSLELFGLSGSAPGNLPDGTYAVETLHILNASLHGASRKAMQFGNRAYGRHLLGLLPPRRARRARRLFVDRPPPQRRSVINRPALLALLTRHGFEPVDPGALPVPEQAALFGEASHVVGLHGAALANLIHCAPGTPVLEIHSPDHATATFAIAALVRGCPYAAFVGESAAKDGKLWAHPQDMDFAVDTAHLERAIREMLR